MRDEHTPGPWKVSDTSIVTDKYCIAVIEDDGGYEAPSDARKANAHLIAAAPDLLVAARFALCVIETSAVDTSEKMAMQKLSDAILKAEGGNP